MIANIAFNDATILPYNTNPSRIEFSERTGANNKARGSTLRSPATAERLRRSFTATRDRKKLANKRTDTDGPGALA